MDAFDLQLVQACGGAYRMYEYDAYGLCGTGKWVSSRIVHTIAAKAGTLTNELGPVDIPNLLWWGKIWGNL